MRPKAVALSLSGLLALSCSSSPDVPECEGKCDGFDLPDALVPDTPCDGIMVDKSGRGLGTKKLAGRLQDPLAKLVFQQGDDCPTNFQDIMAKLEANSLAFPDAAECDMEQSLRTMFVSETAQALGTPTNYRAVTAVNCNSNDPVEPNRDGSGGGTQNTFSTVMFSLFGIQAGAPSLPGAVEVIAFDATQGVFNYYETNGRTLHFFGTSKDMLKGQGQGGDRRCAACHTGGGLVMKELAAPWLHWEGDTTTPGTSELIDAHGELLGRLSDGIDMENLTRNGNNDWNATKIDHLLEIGDTKEILRPLFCDVQFNIENGSSSPQTTDHGEVNFFAMNGDTISNRLSFTNLNVGTAEDYDAIIRANGQQIPGLPAGHIETHFGMVRIVKSSEDEDYIQGLISRGIVDQDFVADVLAVDMTRAIFSDERCSLLDKVPGIPASELSPQTLRAALVDRLKGSPSGTPEAEFFNNLANPRDNVQSRVEAFVDACNARSGETTMVSFEKDQSTQTREVPSVLVDYMKLISLRRDTVRRQPVFEFPQTMPADQQNVPAGTRFHPETCQLTTEFVAFAPVFDPDNSCFERCGQQAPGGCSCAEDCQDSGNCCEDFVEECVIPECAHELCEEGQALAPKCQDTVNFPGNDCVAVICDLDPFCCEDTWDNLCVEQVETECNLRCPAGPSCCMICQNGKPCGDSCIAQDSQCNQDPGCACGVE